MIKDLTKEGLSKLVSVTQRLVSTIELPKLLEIILDSAKSLTNAEASSLLLLDEKIRKLKFAVVTGESKSSLESLTVPLGNSSIAGWVAETGKPMVVNDVEKEKRWYPGVDEVAGFKTRSILCVPLGVGDKIVGVIEVVNKRDSKGFSKTDLELLGFLAQQAALGIKNAQKYEELLESRDRLLKEAEPRYKIVGENPKLKKAIELASRVAKSNTTVLLKGESGTGKELLARYIHRCSPRSQFSFIVINCAAIPSTLIESELFGYEKGAFTGASTRKPGKFELAHKGTLFLDEIGDLALETQVKILRFLEDREFQRLGGKENISVDVRIITATNQRLEELTAERKFREDLYYRLNVFPIELVPLRERKDDIPLLVSHFLDLLNRETTKKVREVSDKAMQLLFNYDWPGNIRELRNVIERAFVITPDEVIREEHILLGPGFNERALLFSEKRGWLETVREFKRSYLLSVLREAKGDHKKAASILKIQPSYLSRLKKELRIEEI